MKLQTGRVPADMENCSTCGNPVAISAQACPHCGMSRDDIFATLARIAKNPDIGIFIAPLGILGSVFVDRLAHRALGTMQGPSMGMTIGFSATLFILAYTFICFIPRVNGPNTTFAKIRVLIYGIAIIYASTNIAVIQNTWIAEAMLLVGLLGIWVFLYGCAEKPGEKKDE